MEFIQLMLLAIGLSLDAFAVALGSATNGYINTKRSAIRLSFHFALFQALMPIAGWIIGSRINELIQYFDHWIAFVLLLFVGGKMIYESFHNDKDKQKSDPSKGWSLVILSLATSIDALVVGFSLALIRVDIWYPSFVIGLTTGTLSLIGIYFGVKLGSVFGKRMELLGGVIIIGIGIRILISHLA
ncbi:MAG: manganese efflux pump [Ignavibacteriae bacterium]|nr:MAG: manganese efflux pump [Ignavibacteriota bacterium]